VKNDMRRPIALITAFSLLTLSVTAQSAPPQVSEKRIEVPRTARPPAIDGQIKPGEWKAAVSVPLGTSGHAWLMHDETFLYVGLVGLKPGIGSICARAKSGGVRVLHASAALGTAAYELEKGKWRLTRPFTWTNRDSGKSKEAKEARAATLAREGWFANTSPTAMSEREYQIPVKGHTEVPLVLSFATFTPEEQKLYYWPAALEDDCANLDLASGSTDGDYLFDVSQWGVVVLKN
jgi:hypothetical protein